MTGDRPDPAYVAARPILLDALEALETQREALVLIGAQAVYLHTGDTELAIAPYTTDADFALDVDRLSDAPLLEASMAAAGFVRRPDGQPGAWERDGIPVDLMTDATQGEAAGRRGARIPPHAQYAARKVRGLEAAILDNDVHTVSALDGIDRRRIEIAVAGPAALIVAKSIKIQERRETPHRLSGKDAWDVFLLLRACEAGDLRRRFGLLLGSSHAGRITRQGLDHLAELFARPASIGCTLLAQFVEGLEDPAEIVNSAVILVRELTESVRTRGSRS